MPSTLSFPALKGEVCRAPIKGVGDYTSTLAQQLKLGDTAQVEGPYGHPFQGLSSLIA